MANVSHSEVASRRVARQPNKPKKGEQDRMHIILPGEVVSQIDDLAAKMSANRPGLEVTRTEIARMAIHEYIQHQTQRHASDAADSNEIRRAATRLAIKWAAAAKPSELKQLHLYNS